MSIIKTIKTEFKDQVSDISFMTLQNPEEAAPKTQGSNCLLNFICLYCFLLYLPQYTKYQEVLRLLESWVQLRTGRIPALITEEDLAGI